MEQNDCVTVIIPTYNRARYLVKALESVLVQTYENLEVIVVNDGSTDDTKECLEPFMDRILYLERPNGGKSAAVNLGLQHANGQYIWIFDDDDIALPDKLEHHMSIYGAHPETKFTYTGYAFFEDDNPEDVVESVYGTAFPEGEMLPHILAESFICSVTVVARKACYDRVGHYDNRLIRFPDYDMCVRFVRAGFKSRVIERPLVKVRRHKGLRGSEQDRFDISKLMDKQLYYQGIVVQKYYWEEPLTSYSITLSKAPHDPGAYLKALLKRTWIVATPMLVEETKRDLCLILDHLAQCPELRLKESEIKFLSAFCRFAMQKDLAEFVALGESILAHAKA